MISLLAPFFRRSLILSMLLLCVVWSPSTTAVEDQAWDGSPSLQEYLHIDGSKDLLFDPGIPTPESVIGFEVGTWHVRHDLLVKYMERLAAASDRIQLTVTGKTYEDRPLLLLTISSPENLERIDEIREQHLRLSDPSSSGELELTDMPLVVNLGYSVHGNEPSGSNAALVVAYALAAAQDDATRSLLEQTVVLLDPSLNPDGLSRFAQWANMHKGKIPAALSASREHEEEWPSGRTNHYWFDLNRDWLPAQHPESRARLAQFHAWRPNVLTDHHEMGTGSTFFFQPGVPTRKNPLTPERNVELTAELAKYHARTLDSMGSLYYSEEDFDDFYYGKGSTYPDIQGGVGILFEQASSRGHLQEADNGPGGRLSFPFTIRNQVAVSFSTLKGAFDNREVLLAHQRDFFRRSLELGGADPRGALIFGDRRDPTRAALLADVLRRHQVELYRPASSTVVDGVTYEPGSAFIVPLAQPQYRFIRAAFDSFTEFQDTTFYDVSAWTLPMAYGLSFGALNRAPGPSLGDAVETVDMPGGSFTPDPEAVAYLFTWNDYFAPRGLYRLLNAGVEARVAGRVFSIPGADGPRTLPLGTVVVPLGLQTLDRSKVEALLAQVAEQDGIEIISARSGLTPSGIDLGSPSLERLETPRPAVIVGNSTSSYEAGEAWHLLDQRFAIETALISADNLEHEVLSKLTHLVFVDRAHDGLSPEVVHRLRGWVRRGGVLIATKSAAPWAAEDIMGSEEDKLAKAKSSTNGKSTSTDGPPARKPYAQASVDRALHIIGGSLFQVELDLSHPLAYGYTRELLPVFRNSRIFLEPSTNPYATVAAYSQQSLLAGYSSDENLRRLAGSPAVIADRVGQGTVVQMVDNPNFRAFWYGTNKLFLNGIFFGSTLDRTAPGSMRRRGTH